MRVYLDTNILIDFVCKREPFYEPSKGIFALGSIGQIELVTSSLSIVIKSILSFVSVCDLQAKVVIKSLDSDWKDYEDYVQSISALESFADCIVTRNKKDFGKSVIPVYTIEELMSLM